MIFKNLLINIFLISGTVIGAGVFSLPLIFNKLGNIFYLLLVIAALFSVYLNERYLFIIKKIQSNDQMPKFISKALGNIFGKITLMLFTLSLLGALVSYLLLIKTETNSIYIFLLISWSILITNPRIIKNWDSILTIILFFLIFILLINSTSLTIIPKFIQPKEISIEIIVKSFGVLLFSFTGFSVIPELITKGKPILANRISYLIIFLVYIYFANFVNLNNGILLKSVIFFAVITSYIPMSMVLEEIFEKDIKIPKLTGKILTLLLPVLIAFWGIKDFITALSLTGGVFIALLQLLIIAAYIKLKTKKNLVERIFISLSIFIFLSVAIGEIYFIIFK